MSSQEALIAQLETYIDTTRAQIEVDTARTPYWRGVLFGLELALLEARKAPPELSPASSDTFYDTVSNLIFERLDSLITLCQSRINRDLLVYNVKTTRYELLKAVRQAAGGDQPGDFELRAQPDLD